MSVPFRGRTCPGVRRAARARSRVLAAFVFCGVLVSACGSKEDSPVRIRFWAMGREGEVVEEIVRDFERETPGVRVDVQQIPWTAAHEKLLTAHVGRSTPDVAQLGNTWIAEFAALRALLPLEDRVERSSEVDSGGYFPGIWDTNVIDGVLYGIPWYVDTRVLFYRKDLLREAGYEEMPSTWEEWRGLLEALKRQAGPDRFAIFLPTNEPTQPIIFGLQAGSPLLAEDGTRGAFSEPPFRRAFRFYVDLFADRLAPPVANTEIANLYQEFERGYFALYITGPWNIGEFSRRLPPGLQDDWGTAPLPGPDGASTGVSLAGGSSLVVFGASRRADAAWRLVEYLSRPDQQLRFYRLTGDLPARREAWADSSLTGDSRIRAFHEQLGRVVATPKIPEWEQVAMRLRDRAEEAVRGARDPDAVLEALDEDVDRILEKRRWLVDRRLRRAEQSGGGEP